MSTVVTQPQVGDRVQVPAYTDTWIMGDRFGVVTRRHPAFAYFLSEWISVRLDKSGKTYKFIAVDCTVVTS